MISILEELLNGDCFEINSTIYIVTCDFKKNGQRLCIDLKTGESRWMTANTIIDKISLLYTNKDNHIIAIKETPKEDVPTNS